MQYNRKLSTAVMKALKQGDLSTIKSLVKQGMDIDHGGEKGPSILEWAIFYNQLEIVKWLIENGANIHVNNDEPLMKSMSTENLELVEYLIKMGANIHAGHDYAIKMAANQRWPAAVELLLSLGSTILSPSLLELIEGTRSIKELKIVGKYPKIKEEINRIILTDLRFLDSFKNIPEIEEKFYGHIALEEVGL